MSGTTRMADGISEYERHQIESLLQSNRGRVEKGVGLFLILDHDLFRRVYDAAIAPAMRACGLNRVEAVQVFGSTSQLNEVCWWCQTAEIIVADLSAANADLMFVVGLACGLRRCPLIISQSPLDLPFNLAALRCICYEADNKGLWWLRQSVERAIRVFLAAAKSGP